MYEAKIRLSKEEAEQVLAAIVSGSTQLIKNMSLPVAQALSAYYMAREYPKGGIELALSPELKEDEFFWYAMQKAEKMPWKELEEDAKLGLQEKADFYTFLVWIDGLKSAEVKFGKSELTLLLGGLRLMETEDSLETAVRATTNTKVVDSAEAMHLLLVASAASTFRCKVRISGVCDVTCKGEELFKSLKEAIILFGKTEGKLVENEYKLTVFYQA